MTIPSDLWIVIIFSLSLMVCFSSPLLTVIILKNMYFLFVCACVCATCACRGKRELAQPEEVGTPFHHVASRDCMQTVGLVCRHFMH